MAESKFPMVSMKRPKGDMHKGAMAEIDHEEYGYGLCLRLENFELDALKLSLPAVGKKFMIHAVGEVTCVHQSESKGNEGDGA